MTKEIFGTKENTTMDVQVKSEHIEVTTLADGTEVVRITAFEPVSMSCNMLQSEKTNPSIVVSNTLLNELQEIIDFLDKEITLLQENSPQRNDMALMSPMAAIKFASDKLKVICQRTAESKMDKK